MLKHTFDDGVATLTLNNPPQNRLSGTLVLEMSEAVQELESRSDVRALLINAEGPDFSYGGDVGAWIGLSESDFSDTVYQVLALTNLLEDLPCPIIVAVQGYCGGGGLEIALRGDIIVAADNATFCHSEATISAFTFLGGIQRVAERVGRTRAAQWALTAELVDAHTAFNAGLINEIVPLDSLDSAAAIWVDRFKDSATLSHAAHKKLLRAWSNGGIEAADALIPEMAGTILHSADAQGCLEPVAEAIKAGAPRPKFKFKGK